jgi:predicted N-acetyltransferase YhbS
MTAAVDRPDPPLLLAERPGDGAVVEALIAAAFGPGRFAKTAERLREGVEPCLHLNVVAWSGSAAMGCVRQWPVLIDRTPALLLGPIAVDDAWRHHGVGSALVRHACDTARRAGHALVLLVGDEPFFGPLGFSVALARHIRLPGPVNQRRVMVKALVEGADADLSGPVRTITA